MNVSIFSQKDYENIPPARKCQNKPNQTQFQCQLCKNKPNRTQFQPKNEANKPNQTQFYMSSEAFAKADSNAGSKRNEAIAASNLRAYGQRGVCRKLAGQQFEFFDA